MGCDYCERQRSASYTIEASVGDTDATVGFEFCSRSCLSAWAAPEPDYSALTVSGEPTDDGVENAGGTWTDRPTRTGMAQD